MTFNPIVSGFNTMAHFLGATVGSNIPKKDALSGTLNFLAKSLPAEGLKTLVVKPLALVGQTLEYINKADEFPVVARLAGEASAFKALMSAIEIITKFPKLVENLTTPVNAPEDSREFAKTDGANEWGPQWTPMQVVSSRLFFVASWIIAVGDVIAFSRHCDKPFRKSVMDLTPWIYTVAGGYMGAQALWTELSFARGTWLDDNKKAAAAEKYYGCLNLVTNTAYLFNSVVGAVGLYYKNNAPASLSNWQFVANAGVIVLPVAQRIAKAYMENVVWA